MNPFVPALNGLLLVDKPGLPATAVPALPQIGEVAHTPADGERLPTSHDVVQRVRGLSQQRRIGHTGTLDPMASGLLVFCLGWATRLVEYYQGHDKQYLARVTLGFETDTYDLLGRVVEVKPVPVLDTDTVERALAGFRGRVEQRPPAYSALKQEGESLHHKARRGEVVSIPTRPVTFHRLELTALLPPNSFEIRVRCTAGAYIRSLAVDLGHALGTAGTLTALRREAAGSFAVTHAHSLATIERAAAEGRITELMLPPGVGLDVPSLHVDAESARRLGHGQHVPLEISAAPHVANGTTVQALDAEGRLLGMLRPIPETADAPALWRADKWFAGEH